VPSGLQVGGSTGRIRRQRLREDRVGRGAVHRRLHRLLVATRSRAGAAARPCMPVAAASSRPRGGRGGGGAGLARWAASPPALPHGAPAGLVPLMRPRRTHACTADPGHAVLLMPPSQQHPQNSRPPRVLWVQVYGVDVGYGQVDTKIRQDGRVLCIERMNLRYLQPQDLPSKVRARGCGAPARPSGRGVGTGTCAGGGTVPAAAHPQPGSRTLRRCPACVTRGAGCRWAGCASPCPRRPRVLGAG